jgi:hypothetical protein
LLAVLQSDFSVLERQLLDVLPGCPQLVFHLADAPDVPPEVQLELFLFLPKRGIVGLEHVEIFSERLLLLLCHYMIMEY